MDVVWFLMPFMDIVINPWLKVENKGHQFKFLWRISLSFRVGFFFFFFNMVICCVIIIVDRLKMLNNNLLCFTLLNTPWICDHSCLWIFNTLSCLWEQLWISWVMFTYFHKAIILTFKRIWSFFIYMVLFHSLQSTYRDIERI